MEMRTAHDPGRAPVLVLGAGASLESGAPASNQIIEKIVRETAGRDMAGANLEDTLEVFYSVLGGISGESRVATLKRYLQDLKPSAGYKDLAALVQTGFFDTILTTNFDLLLERSLLEAGLLEAEHFTVLRVGQNKPEFINNTLLHRRTKVIILKLHGDLNGDFVAFTPEETLQFPPELSQIVTNILRGTIIFGGHSLRDNDLNRCITDTGGTFWYVNPAEPPDGSFVKVALAAFARRGHKITGNLGKFDQFWARIRNELRQEPPPQLPPPFPPDKEKEGGRPVTEPADDVVAVITVVGNRSTFDQVQFLRKLLALLQCSRGKLKRVSFSSIRLLIELPKDKAQLLFKMHSEGNAGLKELGVLRVELVGPESWWARTRHWLGIGAPEWPGIRPALAFAAVLLLLAGLIFFAAKTQLRIREGAVDLTQITVALIGATSAIAVALINKNRTGVADMKRHSTLRHKGIFVWVFAPLLGATITIGAFNGVRLIAGAASLKAPFAVKAYFVPSGYMGDGEQGSKLIELNDQWKGNCHPGPTCIRISYHPGKTGWAGVYWQYPTHNWGDKPGRAVESAKKVIFFARGEVGGELVKFKAGGTDDPDKKYHDSFDRTLEPDPVELKTEWERFEIDLTGADTSSVLGAFAWIASQNGNPNGLTFYLDDIRYE